MKKRGRAKGIFRWDNRPSWEDEKKLIEKKLQGPEASRARKRMIENSITDAVVNDYMGGSDGAAKQAKEYEALLKDIKEGKGVRERKGSLADAARSRMIERQAGNKKATTGGDIGRDRANRQAYPAKGGK